MPYDRRTFLQRSGMGLGALGLAGMLGEAGLAPSAASAASFGSPPTRQHYAGKAKRVIHFFLNGGPSQVDTFDHKPMLAKYAGQPIPETLDFVVDIGDGLAYDQFLWEAELIEAGSATKFHSREQFAGQRMNQLSPWAQLAQTLLLTNEFLFLD